MTSPTHLQMSKLEHGIVQTQRQLYLASELIREDSEQRLNELNERLRLMNMAWHHYHGSATLPKHHVGKNPTSQDTRQDKTQGGLIHLYQHCDGQPFTVENNPAENPLKSDSYNYEGKA